MDLPEDICRPFQLDLPPEQLKFLKPFYDQLFLLVAYGAIIQGVFIVLLLNNKGVRKSRANIFLSILILSLSFSISHILFAGAVIDHLSAGVYSIGDPTFYLIAPLLWFYASELTGSRVSWRWGLLLHFLPFFMLCVLSLSLRSVHTADFVSFLNDQHRSFVVVFWMSVVVQFSWYLFLVRKRWIFYQGFMQQEVSNTENVSISWVRFFMVIFLLINLLFLFSLFAVIHLKDLSWLQRMTAFVFSLSVFALGYRGILQKEIFRKEDETNMGRAEDQTQILKQEKTDPARIGQLLAYMESERPYLNPELTLTELAKGLSMTRSQLSVLVNEGTGNNFYDFINKYRVEQVKKLMADPQMSHFNMLGLALEAGFKSKSTFNLIFKRFTGLTPSEYRKNLTQ